MHTYTYYVNVYHTLTYILYNDMYKYVLIYSKYTVYKRGNLATHKKTSYSILIHTKYSR